MPKGWESQINVFKEAQDAATDEFFHSLASKLTGNLEGLLAVKDARIFDSIKGELTSGSPYPASNRAAWT